LIVKIKKSENKLLLIVYLVVFLYLIFQPAIYSPDTRSYLEAMPYRHLGYVIFIKCFDLFFSGKVFNVLVIAFQAIFGLLATFVFYTKISKLITFNLITKIGLFAFLLFPFLPPLEVANNICSEGLSYPLYLLFVAFGIDFFFTNTKSFKYFIVVFLLLALTRGQFIITIVPIAFMYILKHKKTLFKKPHLNRFIVLLLLPVVVLLADKSYHKLKDGIFMSTPFSFVNISTAAFYVSEKSDSNQLTGNDKKVFDICYNKLDKQKLLLTNQKEGSYKDYYSFFHNHIPNICNRTVHYYGRAFFLEDELSNSTHLEIAQAHLSIENTLRNISFSLINQNFNKWLNLFFANLIHAFNGIVILIIIVTVFSSSLIKLFTSNNNNYYLLFMLSALILSNTLLVCLASHSIIRYLFYNYALYFLIFIILFKQIKHGIKH
jgi:O-antigen ligase